VIAYRAARFGKPVLPRRPTPGVFSCENVLFASGAVTTCPHPLAP